MVYIMNNNCHPTGSTIGTWMVVGCFRYVNTLALPTTT